MGATIEIFNPISDGGFNTFIISTAVALVALGIFVWHFKKGGSRENYNMRMLISMLLFFTFAISGSTAVLSSMKYKKTSPVSIYENGLETTYGSVEFKEIKNASIIADKSPSYVNPNQSTRITRLLIIEEKSGKTHVLSEEDYPIQDILRTMKNAMSN